MEQTIGKRIVANRKRLGLTQDQLAEKVGVTAQAVSKWENDQSCPDIATLPKLANIFGITTDALLGMESNDVVHEAEVMDEENEPEGFHVQNGKWEFSFDGGQKNGIGFAVWVLLAGGLLLAARLLSWNIGFWDILWPSALLVFGVFGLFPRFSFFRLGCAIFGTYFLLSNLKICPFLLDKDLLLPICLLLFGLSLLVDALRKKQKPQFHVTHNGKSVHPGTNKHRSSCTFGENSFQCSTSFGDNRRLITLPKLASGEASVSFGELTVDLSGCEKISENCHIQASCSFGELNILVPRRWRVEHTASTAFADVDFSGYPAADATDVIYIDCSVNFGEIQIKYI